MCRKSDSNGSLEGIKFVLVNGINAPFLVEAATKKWLLSTPPKRIKFDTSKNYQHTESLKV